MSKGFIISITIFLMALVLDLFSLRAIPKEKTFSKLESYVDTEWSYYEDYLTSNENLSLYSKKRLNEIDLKRLKTIEDKLSLNNVFATVYKDNKKLFWKEGRSENSFGKLNRTNDSITVYIGLEFFNDKGSLHKFIYEKSGIQHNITNVPEAESNYRIQGTDPIKIGSRYRSNILNYIIAGCYLLALIFFTLNCIRKQSLILFSITLVGRLLLFLFDWQSRFSDIRLTQNIFDSFQYSSLDLLIDASIISGCLIFLSKSQFHRLKGQNLYLKTATNLGFLSLLFLTHLRLIQLLVNSQFLDISINNLSNIGQDDIIVFSTVLALMASIFIYATSLIVELKESLSKKQLYIGFILSTIFCVSLSIVFKLDINPFVYCLFIISFYALLDLFIDIKYKTITWVIWWSILFGVYLSAIFFNYDIKKDISQRQLFLKESFHKINESKVEEIKSSAILKNIAQEITELLILPEEAQYEREDFNAFLKDRLQRKDFIVEVFSNNGKNIFDKKYKMPSYLMAIDSTTEYDEFHDIVWFTIESIDSYSIKAGFKLDGKPFDNRYLFNYYVDNKISREAIYFTEDELKFISKSTKDIDFLNSEVYIKYKPTANKLLITKKSFFGLVKPIALFSFLFSAIIILIILLGIAYFFVDFLPKNWPFKIQNIDSLNSKIQISLILVILFSFVIIAIITSSFLKSFINTNNETFVENKINAITRDLERKTKFANSEQEAVLVAKNYQEELEKIHDTNLKIYQLNQESNSGDYYPSVYFAKQEEPRPYTHFIFKNQTKNYIPIYYNEKAVGYTVLDYDPDETQRINVFDFLGSIFNVYVFLFLIASVIAIFIARSITKPLSLLNQKLSQLKLGKENELISWEKEDEIGVLIQNYNQMVKQLEESANILAKTERDSAWREMAKQVAHEIKNPLTPMKMYIQHLEKAISQQPHNAKEISKKISTTLMEQIDNLTQIANSFSNFAELPKTSNTKIDLNNVVQVVHNLFRKREDMDITLSEPIDTIKVFADKNQLIRILNNLVKNAIESIPTDRKGEIAVKLYTKNGKAIIQLSDNGIGIPDDMKEKIFQPKFTTKDSGSGLGLAIASNMLESMNGRLYFDSIEGTGTNFYIELDNIRQANYKDNSKRITLE